jgi:hypothetical protein
MVRTVINKVHMSSKISYLHRFSLSTMVFGGHGCWTLRKFNVGLALVELGFLHMPSPHKLGWGCSKFISIQQRQEYRSKLLLVPGRRQHDCLPNLSGRPGWVRGAVITACASTPESSEHAQIKGEMPGMVWMSSLVRLALGFVLLFPYI